MEPMTSAASIRAVGNLGAAVLNRYKPVGVARCGSAEDRAQAYRRLIDALVHLRLAYSYVNILTDQGVSGANPLMRDLLHRLMAAGSEIGCALQGVQLCAPAYVIAVAEEAASVVQRDEEDAEYQRAQVRFLEAARHDLAYNPRPWDLMSKRRARKFRKAQDAKLARRLEGAE